MRSLEQEILYFVKEQGYTFKSYTKSGHLPDFAIQVHDTPFFLEAKEKRQRININNWPTVDVPERELFILDDLSARKLLRFAPNSGLVIRDNLRERYFFFDIVTLMLIPRLRVNRPMDYNHTKLKGKWMIDLRNAQDCRSLHSVFQTVWNYIGTQDTIFEEYTPAWGDFEGEYITLGGEVRTREHRQIDYSSTR